MGVPPVPPHDTDLALLIIVAAGACNNRVSKRVGVPPWTHRMEKTPQIRAFQEQTKNP